MNTIIELTELSREETMRYLGYTSYTVDENTEELFQKAEKLIKENTVFRYVYKLFNICEVEDGVELIEAGYILKGESVKEHLKKCDKAILMCATISENIDNLIRKTFYEDMALSVVIDCMSGVAIEQLCSKFDDMIAERLPDKFLTFRFGIGYGDLSLDHQKDVLNLLDATKRIGVTVTEGNLMLPRKTVTSIMGISDEKLEKKRSGCAICNMREKCRFRKEGSRCNG